MKILFTTFCFLLVFENIFSENIAAHQASNLNNPNILVRNSKDSDNTNQIGVQKDVNNNIINDSKNKDLTTSTDVRNQDLHAKNSLEKRINLETEHQPNEGVTCKRETMPVGAANNMAFSFERMTKEMMNKYGNMPKSSINYENSNKQSTIMSENPMNVAKEGSQQIRNPVRRELSGNSIFGRLGYKTPSSMNPFSAPHFKDRENNNFMSVGNENVEQHQAENNKAYQQKGTDSRNMNPMNNNQMSSFGVNNKKSEMSYHQNFENEMIKETMKQTNNDVYQKREIFNDKTATTGVQSNPRNIQTYGDMVSNNINHNQNGLNRLSDQFMKQFQSGNYMRQPNNEFMKNSSPNFSFGNTARGMSNENKRVNSNTQNLVEKQGNNINMYTDMSNKPNANNGLTLRRQAGAMNDFNKNSPNDFMGQKRIPNMAAFSDSRQFSNQLDKSSDASRYTASSSFMSNNVVNRNQENNQTPQDKEAKSAMIRDMEDFKNIGRNTVFGSNNQRFSEKGLRNEDMPCKRQTELDPRTDNFSVSGYGYANQIGGVGGGLGNRFANYQSPNFGGNGFPQNFGFGKNFL